MVNTKFHVGDVIYLDINGIQTRATVVTFPTTPINIYNASLTFSREHIFYDVDDIDDYTLTADGERYSHKYPSSSYRSYLVLLSSGQTMELAEGTMVKYRNIRRKLDERKMLLLLKSQVYEKDRVRQVKQLPDSINPHIQSYFSQEPLSRDSNNVGGRKWKTKKRRTTKRLYKKLARK